MIYRWVNKFRTHGTVHNLNRKDTNRQSHSGWPKSSRTPHNVTAVRDSVVHSPSKSVRRRSQELGINRESVRRILIADLHMHSYRIQIKQKLTLDDMRKRVIMCQWFCDKIDAVPDFLENVWFSDEAHFLLSGHVNSNNNIFWVSTTPERCLQRPYTLWSALPSLPSPNMASLDHSDSRTTTSGLWQSTPSDMSRCLASPGQHLVDKEGSSGPSGGSSRMSPPPHLKWIIGMATAAFSWPTDQPQVWPAVVTAFTRLEPPRFLYVGIP